MKPSPHLFTLVEKDKWRSAFLSILLGSVMYHSSHINLSSLFLPHIKLHMFMKWKLDFCFHVFMLAKRFTFKNLFCCMMSVMLPANSALEFLQFFPLFVDEIALLHLSKCSLKLHCGNPFFPSLDTCFHTAGYMDLCVGAVTSASKCSFFIWICIKFSCLFSSQSDS